MASSRLVGQVGTLAFGVGVGFLIALGCDSAVASADTGHSGAGSTNSSHAASSGRSHAAPQSALNTPKPAAAQSSSTISAVPASVSTAKSTANATPAAPHVPTPVEVQHAVEGVIHNAEKGLTTLRNNVEYALHIKPAPQRIYGNLNNAQYWATQSAENCVLMATASVIGQLKGVKVSEQQIVNEATSTQSVVDPSRKMYLGLNTDDRVAIGDAEELLRLNGIDATTKDDYRKTQGLIALRNLEHDLKVGKAVMVGVKANAIWDYVHADPPPGAVAEAADHEISVIAINATTGTVYINDSGMDKGGVAVPLKVFMRAWQADRYETTSAVLAQAASAALAA